MQCNLKDPVKESQKHPDSVGKSDGNRGLSTLGRKVLLHQVRQLESIALRAVGPLPH